MFRLKKLYKKLFLCAVILKLAEYFSPFHFEAQYDEQNKDY